MLDMEKHVDRLRKHSLYFKIVLPTPISLSLSVHINYHFTRVWPVLILIEEVTEIFFLLFHLFIISNRISKNCHKTMKQIVVLTAGIDQMN